MFDYIQDIGSIEVSKLKGEKPKIYFGMEVSGIYSRRGPSFHHAYSIGLDAVLEFEDYETKWSKRLLKKIFGVNVDKNTIIKKDGKNVIIERIGNKRKTIEDASILKPLEYEQLRELAIDMCRT